MQQLPLPMISRRASDGVRVTEEQKRAVADLETSIDAVVQMWTAQHPDAVMVATSLHINWRMEQ